ncbi:IS1634 family transposase [Micromonospora aurantiaca (nom. illeg.)]|uniref:IS1634 family transposase n=1 Tax=Micromonospora aurantiaca (nom. illeg.) TaxID=47850 RepID=UPI003F4A412A
MYVRVSSRKTASGQMVRYLQLAHNEWDPVAKMSRTKVLHSFGREDELDRAAIERLVVSLSRLLDPGRAAVATGPAELVFVQSRPFGGTDVLDGLWRALGLDAVMRAQLSGRRLDARVERVLFALVANRCLDASSKLAAADWISNDVHIAGLDAVDEQACYRAMDWLLQIEAVLAKEVYHRVTDLLNLEVDLLFFDTTSTYFEIDEADEPVARDEHGRALADPEDTEAASRRGFRAYGNSKDHRDDLPQVIVGMAVTRDGIPVRVWSWPGGTGDSELIRQARDDMRAWTVSKVVWVADRGFASAANRAHLMRGGGSYIIGERLRSGSAEAAQALSRQGRYATVRDNLQVKEVNLGDGDRWIVCFNPAQAERDAHIRTKMINRLEEAIAGSDGLHRDKRNQLAGVISTKPGLRRYLRITPGGLLRVDQAAVKAEARLDGKYLLRCSDPKLTPEDIATGYKQLLEVERGWRDLKQIIDLRPIFHRREDRIRAHVLLCWLALLLVRVAENRTGHTWHRLRDHLQRLHLATFTGNAGTYRQTSEPTKPQRDIYTALGLPLPKKIIDLTASV